MSEMPGEAKSASRADLPNGYGGVMDLGDDNWAHELVTYMVWNKYRT